MKLYLKGSKFEGEALKDNTIPSYIPLAQEAVKSLAKQIDGEPQNIISEVVFGTPATAHILGGCPMGTNAENGFTNSNHEVFGAPGLYVMDGSVIAANLGVNPSLTITAMAERFSSKFPSKDLVLESTRAIVFSKD